MNELHRKKHLYSIMFIVVSVVLLVPAFSWAAGIVIYEDGDK